MAERNVSTIVYADLRGGRNGSDPPLSIPDDQVVEAINVDYWDGTLANKRGGATAVATTFSAGGPFTQTIGSLIRHVPSASGVQETNAELWAFDMNAISVAGRLAGATTWVAPTLKDDCDGRTRVVGVSFNNKLFLCYDSSQNRLHVWDGSTVRRVGMATPAAAPTIADTGAGTYAAVERFYKVVYVEISGTDTIRRSELSARSTAFSPSGAGLAARVTKPAAVNEGETHWWIYGSPDDLAYYKLASVAVGTTTWDDTTVPSAYSGDAPAQAGMNLPPPSARFIVADGARLLMAAGFETSGGYVTPKETRVWFTPVLGDADIGDDERIPITTSRKNWIDVEDAITGLAGPLNGTIYVFGYRRMWALVPTGDVNTPYRRFTVSREIGCVWSQSIVMAEDEFGSPCLYWMSARGPYRLGPQGLQYCGNDNEDVWSTMHLAASTPAHGVYHADKHQLWMWIATGSASDPDVKMVFDTRLGESSTYGVAKGWTKHTGSSASASCSVLFANTLGATMSRDLKPYIGQTTANTLWKCDTSATNDAGTNFQASITLKPLAPFGLGVGSRIGQGSLFAKAASGVTITQTLIDTYGLNANRTSSVVLTAAGSETRVVKQFEGAEGAGVLLPQITLGDSAAASNQWTLDALTVLVSREERR